MSKVLSIVIPTYNAEKFLDKGLPTFIVDDKDKLDKLEVIIVNDGTPDRSVEVAQKYVDQYPNVFKIVNKENGGHGSAINYGVEHVTGKYFKVIDADDWVDTEALSRTMDILEKEDFDAMIQSFRTFDINTEKYEPWDISVEDTDRLYTLRELMDRWYDVVNAMTFHGVLYNSKFYKEQNYKLIEHVFYEDQEYATIPLSRAKTIKLSNDELYIYRIGDVNQSIATESIFKKLPDFEAVLFRMLEFEPYTDELPDGGKDYWAKKISKFAADTYQVTLIRNPNKKNQRAFAKHIHKRIKATSKFMYDGTKNKYRTFVILNRFHMSEETYQTQFMGFLDFMRKVFRVDKLHV